MFLSEETSITVEDSNGSGNHISEGNINSAMWRTVSISVIPRLALVIPWNSRVVFEPVKVNAGDVGLITFGPTQKDFVPGELQVVVRFRVTDGSKSLQVTAEGRNENRRLSQKLIEVKRADINPPSKR